MFVNIPSVGGPAKLHGKFDMKSFCAYIFLAWKTMHLHSLAARAICIDDSSKEFDAKGLRLRFRGDRVCQTRLCAISRLAIGIPLAQCEQLACFLSAVPFRAVQIEKPRPSTSVPLAWQGMFSRLTIFLTLWSGFAQRMTQRTPLFPCNAASHRLTTWLSRMATDLLACSLRLRNGRGKVGTMVDGYLAKAIRSHLVHVLERKTMNERAQIQIPHGAGQPAKLRCYIGDPPGALPPFCFLDALGSVRWSRGFGFFFPRSGSLVLVDLFRR
jgi:hypothetical protein